MDGSASSLSAERRRRSGESLNGDGNGPDFEGMAYCDTECFGGLRVWDPRIPVRRALMALGRGSRRHERCGLVLGRAGFPSRKVRIVVPSRSVSPLIRRAWLTRLSRRNVPSLRPCPRR